MSLANAFCSLAKAQRCPWPRFLAKSTAKTIITANLDAAFGESSLEAAATLTARRSDPAVPWWWHQYVARHLAERQAAAAKKPDPIEAMASRCWMPFGKSVGFHDPDADVTEFLAGMLPTWAAVA